MKRLLTALALTATLLLPARAPAQGPIDVDVALVLVVDTSESVDASEYALQQVGIANALTNPEIAQAITSGSLGKVAIAVVDFAKDARVVVPWHVLESKQQIDQLAETIVSTPRLDLGNGTSISAGVRVAVDMLVTSGLRATRRVIDVSGDGGNNTDDNVHGITMVTIRDYAKREKVTINGLPIIDDSSDPGLENFYKEWVCLGPESFLIPAHGILDFANAIRRKLIREIS